MLFVGIDWAEDHHDLVVMSDEGRVGARVRIGDDLAGVGRLHPSVDFRTVGRADRRVG